MTVTQAANGIGRKSRNLPALGTPSFKFHLIIKDLHVSLQRVDLNALKNPQQPTCTVSKIVKYENELVLPLDQLDLL
jgi:hypothetical protein